MLKKIIIILFLFTSLLNAQKIANKSPFYIKPSKNPIMILSDIRIKVTGDATTNISPDHLKYIEKEIDKATELINYERFSEAITICDNLESYAPRYYSIYFTRGYAHEKQKSYNLALLDYEKALGLFPKNPFLYERLSLLYSKYNQYENALRVLLTAFKVFAKDYSWLLLAGNLALDNNDIQTADYYYMMIMKTKFKAYAYEGLGNIERKIGRPAVAQDAYDYALFLYKERGTLYKNDYLAPYNIQRMIDSIRKLNNYENTIPL